MAELITMPKLGFDMAEGKLSEWLKKPGEAIAQNARG
ncbi:MAG: lipoyl domain-containing protein [Anaerolineae bacterium]|nr:lipoyl domain-containing protein [Anaerolineae bacterium]